MSKAEQLMKKLPVSLSVKSPRTAEAGSRVGARDTYWVQLDGLRAFAVMAVMVHHFLEGPGELGHFPVRLFFVLSGFLITGILLNCRRLAEGGVQSKGYSIRQFYARRFLRIFPLYYMVIVVAWSMGVSDVREALFWHLSYLSNFYFARIGWYPAATAHLWSLSVEEQFYLLWPAVVLFVPGRWLLRTFVLMIAVGNAFRLLALLVGMNWVYLTVSTPSSFDSLAMGALLAYLCQKDGGNPRWQSYLSTAGRWVACTGILMKTVFLVLGLSSLWTVWLYFSYTLWPLVCLWLIDRARAGFGGWVGGVLTARPVVYLGKISYGAYVYHLFMLSLVPALFQSLGLEFWELPALLRFVVLTTATIVVASLSWFGFEKPINGLKRHFPYKTQPS
ncbi:MAG: acyltransferase [Candidatus Thiodiazotropha sp. (ex Rostrolucina anterorostrata)]|nr:acyltransferase [Candidatus Thiodiazotropha sp. (ex Rostrolucina anterorostrata)]